MKKILTVFLSLCLLASLATCFAFSASAEETDIEVTVNQAFEWNKQSGNEAELAWRTGGGKSPDGLWRYQFYAIKKNMYVDMVYLGGGYNEYVWNATPGPATNGFSTCRVRHYGGTFQPSSAADAVKVFTCPSGGTIQISTTVNLNQELVAGKGASFSIYVEDRLVYPEEGNGEFLPILSTTPQTIDVTIDVAKNERVRFRVGSFGEEGSNNISMLNTITYKSVNDKVGEQVEGGSLNQPLENTNSDLLGGGKNHGSDRVLPDGNDGLSAGAIVGIVVAVVAVVGIAVAVVVIMKKKKQE